MQVTQVFGNCTQGISICSVFPPIYKKKGSSEDIPALLLLLTADKGDIFNSTSSSSPLLGDGHVPALPRHPTFSLPNFLLHNLTAGRFTLRQHLYANRTSLSSRSTSCQSYCSCSQDPKYPEDGEEGQESAIRGEVGGCSDGQGKKLGQ